MLKWLYHASFPGCNGDYETKTIWVKSNNHWDEFAGIVLQNVCMSSFEPAPSGAFEVLIRRCDYKGKESI